MTDQEGRQTVLDVVRLLTLKGCDIETIRRDTFFKSSLNYTITFQNKYSMSLLIERWFYQDNHDDMDMQCYAEVAMFKPDGTWFLPENAAEGHRSHVEYNADADRILSIAEYISAL